MDRGKECVAAEKALTVGFGEGRVDLDLEVVAGGDRCKGQRHAGLGPGVEAGGVVEERERRQPARGGEALVGQTPFGVGSVGLNVRARVADENDAMDVWDA